MTNKSNPAIVTMGIDIGKNSFHVVGLDQRGAIVLRQKRSRGQIDAAREPPAVSDRHGGLRWRASLESQATISRPRCTVDAGKIRPRIFERTKK
jgi:hypothetical protein